MPVGNTNSQIILQVSKQILTRLIQILLEVGTKNQNTKCY
jgi:hypothetical protein